MPTKPTGRPRGRPKGAKNIPKVEDFVAEALAGRVEVPEPKPKAAPRGPWAGLTPEQRSEYARKLAAKRKGPSGGRRVGVPRTLTVEQFEARKAEQTIIVERIMKKMAENDQLPDDPRAVEALKESMVILRTQEDAKLKLAAARLVLDFTKAKPTSKQEITVKTAEDYLDEIADD
ncbi:hypothetical protein [Novosphingobium panipatense]|uniref:DUF5681 domain-containing protein n=2 Tax=Novosphingobium panipatense TaxID=428991 RepID=A0ABY1Q4E5_9SPHN|nr:hypothetical protein [Novosphingobium panipatense]SMP58394.1 hypothetical protein SAMN06296065_102462 [Novosphingobium panipatense]